MKAIIRNSEGGERNVGRDKEDRAIKVGIKMELMIAKTKRTLIRVEHVKGKWSILERMPCR